MANYLVKFCRKQYGAFIIDAVDIDDAWDRAGDYADDRDVEWTDSSDYVDVLDVEYQDG